MAAIGRKSHLLTRLFCAVLMAGLPCRVRAADTGDARGALSHIATALSAGDAADAMTVFDKSYTDYGKLRKYFDGLTNAFQVASEISVSEEQDGQTEIEMSVHWTLTLTDPQTKYTVNRAADISVKLIRSKGKWKISELEPIELFNPAAKSAPKA